MMLGVLVAVVLSFVVIVFGAAKNRGWNKIGPIPYPDIITPTLTSILLVVIWGLYWILA